MEQILSWFNVMESNENLKPEIMRSEILKYGILKMISLYGGHHRFPCAPHRSPVP
jgi:hypothetical protein